MRRLVAGVAVVAAAMLAVLPSASAQPRSDLASARSAVAPGVALLAQPAWSPLGSDVAFRLRIVGATPGLEVRATVHQHIESRTQFERTVVGDSLGSVLVDHAVPAALLPRSPAGGQVFTLPLAAPGASAEGRVRVPLPRGQSAAVFPVEFELRDPESGNTLSSFVTHLVAVAPGTGDPIGHRLVVSWVWRIASAPATLPNGTIADGFAEQIAPGGRLDAIAAALGAAHDVPITLAPSPETLQAWQTQAHADAASERGLTAIRSASDDQEVLTSPYVPIDGPSLDAGGLGDAVSRQLAEGNRVVDDVLDTQVNAHTIYTTPLSDGYLRRLSTALVDHVVTEPRTLQDSTTSGQFTAARPFELATRGTTFAGAQTDPGVEALLTTGSGTDALRAQRFLADLSVIALEQPNLERGLVIGSPLSWSPTTATLAAALRGLHGNPLLAPESLDAMFASVPPAAGDEGPEVRQLAPLTPVAPPVTAAAYQRARHQLDGLTSSVPDRNAMIVNGERAMLLALSATNGRAQATAQLDSIYASVRTVAAGVHAPSTRTVTLTSQTAKIPVSIQNDTGTVLTIRVALDSSKLQFPGGSQQVMTLLPGRNRTRQFTVRARASGTFPLHISITTADGGVSLQQARYTVRSTFVSGVGLFLTIGAALFLAGWWLTHWRKSRRRTAPALAT